MDALLPHGICEPITQRSCFVFRDERREILFRNILRRALLHERVHPSEAPYTEDVRGEQRALDMPVYQFSWRVLFGKLRTKAFYKKREEPQCRDRAAYGYDQREGFWGHRKCGSGPYGENERICGPEEEEKGGRSSGAVMVEGCEDEREKERCDLEDVLREKDDRDGRGEDED